MIKEIEKNVQEKMDKTLQVLKNEYGSIRSWKSKSCFVG